MEDNERMREAFEAGLPHKTPAELQLTEWGTYPNPMLELEWKLWQLAWQARDAEVQALRAVNNQLHRMVSFFASSIKSGEQWSAYHEEEMTALRAAHKEVADAD